MVEKILQFLEPYKGSKMLLACSGGVDSMVLLDILLRASFDIAIVHFNHHLRGEASDKDAALVQDVAAKNKILCHSLSINFDKDQRNFQEVARKKRYKMMDDLCTQFKYQYILTAHHQDDQVETILMNFARGTDLWGLNGISSKRDNILRPMMGFPKAAIRAYASENQVVFREDASNDSNKYRRNIVRNQIIPNLEQAFPNVASRILATKQNVSDALSFIELQHQVFVAKHIVSEGPFIKISKEGFDDPELGYYHLFLALRNYNFNKVQCRDLVASLTNIGAHFHSKSHEVFVGKFDLVVNPRDVNLYKQQTLKEWPTHIKLTEYMSLESKKVDTCHAFTFDAEKVAFPLICRLWEPGDKIKLAGMHGKRKKVKAIFNEMGLAFKQKSVMPILLDKNYEIVWVPGFRVSESVLANPSSKDCRIIELKWINA